jgi:hypothetical protein
MARGRGDGKGNMGRRLPPPLPSGALSEVDGDKTAASAAGRAKEGMRSADEAAATADEDDASKAPDDGSAAEEAGEGDEADWDCMMDSCCRSAITSAAVCSATCVSGVRAPPVRLGDAHVGATAAAAVVAAVDGRNEAAEADAESACELTSVEMARKDCGSGGIEWSAASWSGGATSAEAIASRTIAVVSRACVECEGVVLKPTGDDLPLAPPAAAETAALVGDLTDGGDRGIMVAAVACGIKNGTATLLLCGLGK